MSTREKQSEELRNLRAGKPRSLTQYLLDLSGKNKMRGDEAVPIIVVDALKRNLESEFVEKNFATLLYWLLFCVRKNPIEDMKFALRGVGILGMVTMNQDHAHEGYMDSIPLLSQVIKLGYWRFMALECLAIVTFFGAMQVIWNSLNPESEKVNIVGSSQSRMSSGATLATAISAWSFLLFLMPYLTNLIEQETNSSVLIAAGEALTLISQIDPGSCLPTRRKKNETGQEIEHVL